MIYKRITPAPKSNVYSTERLKIKLAHWEENDEILVSRERVAAFKEWMDR